MRFSIAALFALIVAPSAALATSAEEIAVLRSARDAFEFRNFTEVIAILDPWVHPPRIVDRTRLAEAQELLGISLHVAGQTDRAKREFEEVLLFDPDKKLDAFVVPPAVIQSFESVRDNMKDVLAKVRAERGLRPPEIKEELPEVLPHPIFAWLPFGIPYFFALDEPAWGSLWLGLQILGIGANMGAYWLAKGLEGEDGKIDRNDAALNDRYGGVMIVGAVVFASAWTASAIQGQALYNSRNAERRAAAASARAVGFSPIELGFDHRGVELTLRF